MARFTLSGFSEEETRDYLRQQGVLEEARIRQILETSGGLPLYVSALSSVRGGEVWAEVAEPAERYLAWLDDPRRRQCVVYCAAARRVDLDVLRALMGDEGSEDLANWLASVPFVRRHDGRGLGEYWDYHPLMRRLLLEFALSRSGRVGQALHARLRASYRDRYGVQDASVRDAGPDARATAAMMEGLYHGLMQDSDDAIREGLDAFLRSLRRDVAVAGQVVQTWLQAAGEQRTNVQVARWADLLDRAWRGMQAEAWSMVMPLCAALDAREGNLSRGDAATGLFGEAREAAYLLHAIASLAMGDYGGGVEKLERTLELGAR